MNSIYDDANTYDFINVTAFVKACKQPRGGYLNKKMFEHKKYGGEELNIDDENLHHTIIGTAVEFLTSAYYNKTIFANMALIVSGARLIDNINGDINHTMENFVIKQARLIDNIEYLSDGYITLVCQLIPFIHVYRSGRADLTFNDLKKPDITTLEHLRVMTTRSINFFGPHLVSGLTFTGAYKKIAKGDADFMTRDTIYDMKVSKRTMNKDWSLQVYVYYLLAKYSRQKLYSHLNNIGIYNPRKDESFILCTNNIPISTEKIISQHLF